MLKKKDEKVIEQDLPPIIIPKNDKLEEKTIKNQKIIWSDKQKIINKKIKIKIIKNLELIIHLQLIQFYQEFKQF